MLLLFGCLGAPGRIFDCSRAPWDLADPDASEIRVGTGGEHDARELAEERCMDT